MAVDKVASSSLRLLAKQKARGSISERGQTRQAPFAVPTRKRFRVKNGAEMDERSQARHIPRDRASVRPTKEARSPTLSPPERSRLDFFFFCVLE